MKLASGAVVLLVALGTFGLALGLGPAGALAQSGMSPGSMNGMGMMGGMGIMGGPFSATSRPLSMDRAVQILKEWPSAHHIDGLVLDEVEAYTQNFYGQFKEQATERGAIQVLVDRYTGRAMPEMGPNMMWNTKYGHAMMQEMMDGMGMMNNMGMMGGSPSAQQAATISEPQAKQSATQFLDGYLPGARIGEGDAFYGYYHFYGYYQFDVLRGIR